MNLTFASSKGGVGKSTTCACVGALLAHRGDRVLIFDLDKNQPLAKWAELLDLDGLTVMTVEEEGLREAYKTHAGSGVYDHILIDLAGVDARVNLKAISAAHLVVIPANVSKLDIDEAEKMIDRVADISEAADREIPYRLLFTMMRALGPTNADREILTQASEKGLRRLKAEVTQRDVYKKMFLHGALPFVEDIKRAGPELEALLEEIEAVIVEAWAPSAMKEAG